MTTHLRWMLHLGAGLLLAAQGSIGSAQSVSDNAITESSDAFGRSVGSESTGLYNSAEIRGFNPVDAGNVRMDSLYFDQVSNVSFRLIDGTTIRVGFSTQGYSFPAPTGLVDYDLAEVGSDTTLTLDFNSHLDAWEPHYAAELRVPLDEDRLGFYLGGAMLDFRRPDGRDARSDTYGGVVRWKPYQGASISAFAWRSTPREEEARPILFTDGTILPPKIERGIDLSQPWADTDKIALQLGVVAHLPVAGLLIEAGAFSDRSEETSRFADLLNGVAADGSVADRVIIADAGGRDHSRSGEIRAVKRFRTGKVEHRLTFSLRGRMRDRLFGGAQRISLGPSTVLAKDLRALPDFTVGPKSTDEVRQLFYGAAYSGYFFDRLLIDAGLSRTNYRKRVDFADPARADVETRDSPLLWNASAAFDITKNLSAFVGLARGMEEALVAPDRAVNRSEAPPAIRTRQEEAGLRFATGNWLTLVVSAFRISKPYYNLDPALRYRLLGTVVNEGFELSMLMKPAPGVTLLGGAVLSDPQIAGEAVDSGLVGAEPIGQARRRFVGNLNWRLAKGTSPLSFDLALERSSGRMADAANLLALPAKTVLDLGFRYRFDLGGAKVLLRGILENALGDYAWDVTPSGGLTYSDPRRMQLQLIADF